MIKDFSDVRALAANQDGLITARQLEMCGVSAKVRRNALRDGRLERIEATVFSIGGLEMTWRRRLRAGLFALGPKARVSYESAAALHGLDQARDATPGGPFEFTMPRDVRRRLREGTVHGVDVVGSSDVVRVDGMRCSSATMVILELARAGVSCRRLGPMLDSAVRHRWTSVVTLTDRLSDLRGWRGVATIDELLPESGGESPLERLFLGLLRRSGLERPHTQYVVRTDARRVARVDFHYPERRLVVEVTGRLGHASDSERSKDAQRRNELVDLGYKVCEYERAQVEHEGERVVAEMRRRQVQNPRARGWRGGRGR